MARQITVVNAHQMSKEQIDFAQTYFDKYECNEVRIERDHRMHDVKCPNETRACVEVWADGLHMIAYVNRDGVMEGDWIV